MGLTAVLTLDYTVLPCRDLRRMRRFYSEVMGFTIAYERDDWVRFQFVEVALALRPYDERLFGGMPNERSGSVQLAFRVARDDVDGCHQELEARGVRILDPPKDQSWGHRTLYFADPESNVLEIYAVIV